MGADGRSSVDPRAPAFFLSYARESMPRRSLAPPPARHGRVHKLFSELSAHVGELLPPPPGQDAGFLDRTMSGGAKWEAQILQAVGTCRVFIALIAPRYVAGSEWCALEWDAFSRRLTIPVDPAVPNQSTAILPVRWLPTSGDLPPEIAKLHMFDPPGLRASFRSLYEAHGLYGLLSQDRFHRDVFATIVWMLALEVCNVALSVRVEPKVLAGTTGLRRSFDWGIA
jgi:hypothetical protein